MFFSRCTLDFVFVGIAVIPRRQLNAVTSADPYSRNDKAVNGSLFTSSVYSIDLYVWVSSLIIDG